ncbi:Ras GTPase activating protein ira2 [Mortierella hygrophila]|uniref:Ras GTPase activating protein ira2 n=1 Tax=Mortierella hygrophila TaxID=979708 RepID=A0A9P6K0R5_9FUNG|nr:Ras GTPase activating protein ira2 [Mortierella hygrophila]
MDPLIQQSINSLLDLSRYRLGLICHHLVNQLENISKQNGMVLEESVPYDVLQSQMFVLRILSQCMDAHWKAYRDQLTQHLREANDNSSETLTNGSDLTVTSISALASARHSDPPPLDDALAKYVLSVLTRFLQDVHPSEDTDARTEVQSSSSNNNSSRKKANETDSAPISSSQPGNNLQEVELSQEIYKTAGKILFYISASNWPIVFARLKARIQHLSTTNDDWPETAELKLLETASLNQRRLGQVLTELRSSFLHLKRSAQTVMGQVLHKAIWNWIETFPSEFVVLCQTQRRMEGEPHILFDICHSIATDNKRRIHFWPLQTMLLILCPDILLNAMNDDDRSNQSKKAQFLAALKKSLRNKSLMEISGLCYVDICKASTYVSKNDTSALRHLVPEIENELKELLFTPAKPYLDADGTIDKATMSSCLTALYRLNPRHVIHSLIPELSSEKVPIAFKLVLVTSFYTIASEEDRLPWNPSIQTASNALGAPLRRFFAENVVRERVTDILAKKINIDRKLKKQMLENARDKQELIIYLLKMYQIDASLAVATETPETVEDEIHQLLKGLLLCLNESHLLIRSTAGNVLLQLFDSRIIKRWGSGANLMVTFWNLSSDVIISIARQLMELKCTDEKSRFLLELLQQLMSRRNIFLKEHQDLAIACHDIPKRFATSVALEIALLILICASDQDICTMAVNCISLLCEETVITQEVVNPNVGQLSLLENIDVYMELSAPSAVVAGRVSQQKRLRKIIRQISQPTPGNLGAWEEAYRRWKNITVFWTKDEIAFYENMEPFEKNRNAKRSTALPAPPKGGFVIDPSDSRNTEWQHFTGFLAALAGASLPSNAAPRTNASGENFRRSSVNETKAAQGNVERYMLDMVQLLVNEQVFVRDVVKQTLGSELSPALYPVLFKQLIYVVSRFFDSHGEPICTDQYTMFVDQAISVLKLVLDRMSSPSDAIFSFDFGALVLYFARYLHRLGHSLNGLRVKIKMCQLCETLMQKKEYISLRQEIRLRNKMVEVMIEWTSDFSLPTEMPSYVEDKDDPANNGRLYRDLDLACMKSIVSLLYQLPLQPYETTHDTDMTQIRSAIFYRYFNFFLKLLNRCRVLEYIESGPSYHRQNNEDLAILFAKSKAIVRDLGPLKDYTIKALSNMLSANIETGLNYSLSMGYHEDDRTRTAFMQVLTNILKQGTEFAVLSESAMEDRYEKLIDLIASPDLNLVLSLCHVCPVSEIDDLAVVLLHVFESRGLAMPLLKAIIMKEVRETGESELFRRNCMATRLLTVFAKLNGAEYLKSTLQPLLNALMTLPAQGSYELDPARLGPEEDDNVNFENLKNMAQVFLDTITDSASKVPNSFKEVCWYLSQAVGERFPDAKFTAVGGFIFLRFLCPAIVAPESDGLLHAPIENTKVRRGLLLITKVIQNLANNVLFGAKEPFMIVLNTFLTSNIHKVTRFLGNISTPQPMEPASTDPAHYRAIEVGDRSSLHRHLVLNLERMSKDLTMKTSQELEEDKTYLATKRSFDTLSTLLAQLGPPPERHRRDIVPVTLNIHQYHEFMRKNRSRVNDNILKDSVFYEGGLSKERRPVFYFVMRKLSLENLDLETVMYRVFLLLEPVANKSFDLVVDVTGFGASNEISDHNISQFLQLLPSETALGLCNLFFVNVNSAFRRYTKSLSRQLTGRVAKRVIFPSSLQELYEFIAPSELRLPKSTTSLEADANIAIGGVSKLTPGSPPTPVQFKIGHEVIQIVLQRKQEIFTGMNCQYNDVYHISELDDISKAHSRGDDGEFFIIYEDGTMSMTFTSPKRDQIISAVAKTKQRFLTTKPASYNARVIRPNDVPGTLLTMALFNLSSPDSALRLASYNLLCALSDTFKFDTGNQLLSAKGLCIPTNNAPFIRRMSEMLARTESHLTLEFLTECFVGFQKTPKALKPRCLEFVSPWLSNLAKYCRSSSDNHAGFAKTREIIKGLIDMTVNEPEIYGAMQDIIWSRVEEIDALVVLVLDLFITESMEGGIGSVQAEKLGDSLVTLSSVSISGKVISRLRKVISKTGLKPMRQLTDHPSWTEIGVLVRFCMNLSFNDTKDVLNFLPEVCHIVTLLVAAGASVVRSAVHGMVTNIVQALATTIPTSEPNHAKLLDLLQELSENKYRMLFGLSRSYSNSYVISPETLKDFNEPMPLSWLDNICKSLMDVVELGSPTNDAANAARARWMGLVTSTAFQFNPAIQPRAFVALGCLAREEVDDDLLYQILVALRGALAMFTEADTNLIASIVMCLTNIAVNLPAESRYLQHLFWLGLSIVEIGHVPLFTYALELLQAVLKVLDAQGFFIDEPVDEVLLRARMPLLDVTRDLDESTGLNFETHFSFGVAGALLKGLKHPSTKTITTDVLRLILQISVKGTTPNMVDVRVMGYLAALLPQAARNMELKELLQLVGITSMEVNNAALNDTYYKMFDYLVIPDNTTGLLLVTLVVTMLQNAETESERLFLYAFLAEAAVALPEVFALVYESLLPKMNQIINSSQIVPIIDAVQSIIFAVVADPVLSAAAANTQKASQLAYLTELGFAGLMDTGAPGFNPSTGRPTVHKHALLVSELVERIIQ